MEFFGKPLFPATILGVIASLLLLFKIHYVRPNYLATGSIIFIAVGVSISLIIHILRAYDRA